MYYRVHNHKELFSHRERNAVLKHFADLQWRVYAFKRLKDFHQPPISWSSLFLFIYYCLCPSPWRLLELPENFSFKIWRLGTVATLLLVHTSVNRFKAKLFPKYKLNGRRETLEGQTASPAQYAECGRAEAGGLWPKTLLYHWLRQHTRAWNVGGKIFKVYSSCCLICIF